MGVLGDTHVSIDETFGQCTMRKPQVGAATRVVTSGNKTSNMRRADWKTHVWPSGI